MNVLSDNIMDILNSPDEGFLSMEDSSNKVASIRTQNQCTSHNPIYLTQITDPEFNSQGNIDEEPENSALGICAECARPIMEQYYLVVDGQTWHLSCLRCAICNCDLQWQSSCFSYEGRLVCREDYRRRTECLVCERRFKKEERVQIFQDGRSFHCECLRCHQCGREIQKCEGFICLQKTIFCLGCSNQRPKKRKLTNSPSLDARSSAAFSNSLNTPNSNRENETGCEQNRSASGTSASSENPRKRHRTSFKQTQLEIMKDYFRINQNPDKNELLQMAERTGLRARILQVWFQNARANFRRRSSNRGAENAEATTSQNSSISGGTPVGDFESSNEH